MTAFEQALEVGQDRRPASADAREELVILLVQFVVGQRQLHHRPVLFKLVHDTGDMLRTVAVYSVVEVAKTRRFR